MLIINKQHREGERAHLWIAVADLPHNGGQFLINTWGQILFITSRSGVLRPSSDNSKDETHMLFLLIHTGKIHLFIQIFKKKNHKTETEHHTSET